jgi:putative PEP-CTERM system TPR-repeat lipoprotein
MVVLIRRTVLFPVLAVALCWGCANNPERAKAEYLKSGDRYFAEKRYQEAIVQYRNAIQQDPKFGEARLKLAEVYEVLGDGSKASAEYIRAADALPNNLDAQVKGGAYLLLLGRFEEARGRAQRALKIDPKNIKAQIVLGNALAGLKEFDAALKELEAATRLDPVSIAAQVSVGTLQMARGNRPDAEAAFRKAVQTNPKVPETHLALANFLWSSGKFAEAEEALKGALAADENNLLTRRALAFLYIVTGRALEAEPHFKALAAADQSPGQSLKIALADYYVGLNRPDQAAKVLEEVAKSQDGFGAARVRQAALQYSRQNQTEANRLVDEVLAKDKTNVPALLVKARFLLNAGQTDDALARTREAAASDPTSIQAQYMLGTVYRAKHQLGDAAKAFNEVLRLNPKAVAAQIQLTQLNLASGGREPALQLAQDAAKTLPRDPQVAINLVKAYGANGDYKRADIITRRLITAFPNRAEVHALSGGVALGKHDRAAASRAFSKALSLDPNNFDALAGAVMIDLEEKRVEAARGLVDERLARQPEDPRVTLLSAQVYAAAGDGTGAERTLRKLLDDDPSHLAVYSMLAHLYLAQKKLPEARASLEAVIARRPDAIGPQTMLAVLDESVGNRPQARERYERILQLDANAAVAANNLAFIYADDGGNLDLALQYAQVAKQKLPDIPQVNDTLGWVYVKRGLPSLAIPPLERAATLAPKRSSTAYHLGVAYGAAGDHAKARASLEKALQLGLTGRDADEAKKLLSGSADARPTS